jgi:hypothetical protein
MQLCPVAAETAARHVLGGDGAHADPLCFSACFIPLWRRTPKLRPAVTPRGMRLHRAGREAIRR